jgi:Amt family ammonium transporter
MNSPSNLDTLWVIVCAFLVFMMQFGFAMLETGCARSKNTINVAMKNLADSTFGFFFFWLVGFGLMFGLDSGGLIGTSHFMIAGRDYSLTAFFFFQAMFATTSATIVSGAVAERMKFNGYVLLSIAVTAIIYPIFGHWAWGEGGWLKAIGFVDFAGSTVVHSVGAWIGLAGAIILGPRIGRFHKSRPNYFSPSNHNVIVFGTLMLWFAWFGFNAGSLLRFGPEVATILLNTLLSAAAGGIAAYLCCLFMHGKVGVEPFSFGIIAGLVGITAGCAEFDAPLAVFIGLMSAPIMLICEQLLQRLRIDDPLSVVAIHGCVGVWGTMSVGLFAPLPQAMTRLHYIGVQASGVVAAFGLAFSLGLLFFSALKASNILRVRKRYEVLGLNVTEHAARLPWVETIESIIRIMRTGQFNNKIHEERGTEVGIVARFFNYLLGTLSERQNELVTNNRNLQSQAQIDSLTKVLNRHGLKEIIGRKTSRNEEFTVVMIDIDHFKQINDNYGHNIGDLILKEISTLIQTRIRATDTFSRWGGEEFVLVIDSIDQTVAGEIAEKLREVVETHQFYNNIPVTCSFGICSPQQSQTAFETLLEKADKALYQAKEAGRNQICCY